MQLGGHDNSLGQVLHIGMLKIDGQYQQFEPSIFLDHGKIPSIPIGSSFTYLGKLLNFEMKNNEAKEAMVNKLSHLLKITNALPIRTQLKLNILNKYIHANLIDDLKKIFPGCNLDQAKLGFFMLLIRANLAWTPSLCLHQRDAYIIQEKMRFWNFII